MSIFIRMEDLFSPDAQDFFKFVSFISYPLKDLKNNNILNVITLELNLHFERSVIRNSIFLISRVAGNSITCNHARSYWYFAESIRNPYGFTTFKCDNYMQAIRQNCTEQSNVFMGNVNTYEFENNFKRLQLGEKKN